MFRTIVGPSQFDPTVHLVPLPILNRPAVSQDQPQWIAELDLHTNIPHMGLEAAAPGTDRDRHSTRIVLDTKGGLGKHAVPVGQRLGAGLADRNPGAPQCGSRTRFPPETPPDASSDNVTSAVALRLIWRRRYPVRWVGSIIRPKGVA